MKTVELPGCPTCKRVMVVSAHPRNMCGHNEVSVTRQFLAVDELRAEVEKRMARAVKDAFNSAATRKAHIAALRSILDLIETENPASDQKGDRG